MQQELKRGLVFIVLVLAATAPWTPVFSQDDGGEPPPERTMMVSSGLDSEALALAYPDQAVWLESERFGRALALFEPEQTAQPEGAVLLLADEGQSASAGLAGAVRELFAEAGWAAMTLGLPALPLTLEQARKAKRQEPEAAGEDAAPEPQSIMIDVMNSEELDDIGEDYRARIQGHLAAAVVDLKERGYSSLVLVGVGRGAGHVISLVTDGAAEPMALVLITPEFETAERLPVIGSLKAVTSLSLLDIVSSRSGGAAAKERQSRMKREGIAGYQQQAVAMGPRPLPRDARGLVNRVTAWLQSRD